MFEKQTIPRVSTNLRLFCLEQRKVYLAPKVYFAHKSILCSPKYTLLYKNCTLLANCTSPLKNYTSPLKNCTLLLLKHVCYIHKRIDFCKSIEAGRQIYMGSPPEFHFRSSAVEARILYPREIPFSLVVLCVFLKGR
jgi:hypothetical protein